MKKLHCTILFYPVAILIASCTNSPVNDEPQKTNAGSINQIRKPPATYPDTMEIGFPAAVFYHADSLQLQQIKEITDTGIFEAQMHEYFYQMRNARTVLNRDWKHIKIREAKNIRYLLFIKSNNDSVYIDLNARNDPYGLYLFDGIKDPGFADMMNVETQLSFYFDK